MERFDEKGYWIIPEPRKSRKIRDDGQCIVIRELYCHNGHNVIADESDFHGNPGFKLLVEKENGERGHVYYSPIYGDNVSVAINIKLKIGEKVRLFCPVCEEEIPTLKPCDWCDNGDIKVLSLKKNFDYNQAIGMCEVVGCLNSIFIDSGELIGDDMQKVSATDQPD
jgi:hypothetical protein